MQSYEVEIKSLLGSSERADEIRQQLKQLDPTTTLQSKNKQLNHYFQGGTLAKLAEILSPSLSGEAKAKLNNLVSRAKEFSVRTRDKDGTVYIVVKVSVGSDTSSNGVSRMEFEEKMPLTLDELDKLVLSAGFNYQAKWSREREEYLCRGVNVTLDKNAGYGWLAEFEMVVDDESTVAKANHDIRNFMQILFVTELKQDRLERMFKYYNEHWQEYYGTDKVFTIE
jgi:adenylate cyclase class IV